MYLDAADFSRALHPRRDVDGVAPNVVVGLPRPDDPGGHRSVIDAHLQHEMIEALLVDVRQCLLQLQSELHENREMTPSRSVLRLHRLGYSRGGHVGRSYRLDLDNRVLELNLI